MGAWSKNLLKRYYLFNIYGERIGEYSKKELLEKFNLKECSVYSAIKRVSVILGKYYISHDKNFNLPNPKSYSHNPVLSKKLLAANFVGFRQVNLDFLFEYEIGVYNNPSILFL